MELGKLFFLLIGVASGVLGIYDGTVTNITKYPFMVAIDCSVDFTCAGAIIGKKWVLYNADCTKTFRVSDLQVYAGSGDKWSGTMYQVEEILVHPNFEYGSLDYDFGLLKVSGFKWSDTVKKVRLPKKELKSGHNVTMVGWGAPGSDMREGTMQVISRSECETFYRGTNITESMGCVYSNGGPTPCSYDDSDPIVYDDTLYHLTTYYDSDKCSENALPTITANVYKALDWIKEVTKIHNSPSNYNDVERLL